MKKTTRTLLGIGGAFCLIGALLFGIGFTSGGTKYVHSTTYVYLLIHLHPKTQSHCITFWI